MHERLNLFVGKNGAGKTTILDAIAVATSTFWVVSRVLVAWTRSLNSAGGRTTIKDAQVLVKVAEKLQRRIMEADSEVTLPILSYYGTGRLYAQKKEKRDLKTLQKFNRQVGYVDCMAAEYNEKIMLNWTEIERGICYMNRVDAL